MRRLAVDRSRLCSGDRYVVISQVPPPHHGSTVMTEVLLDTLEDLELDWHLVDRRFSTSLGEVGKFSFGKVLRGVSLIARLLYSHFRFRPKAYILFITNRPASFLIDWVLTELIRMSGRPLITYVHTRGYRELASRNRIYQVLVRRALGSAQETVCLGAAMVDDIEWATDSERHVIPNTPHQIPCSAPLAVERPMTYLFLSNLLPEKGAETFIDAAIKMATLEPTAKFVVAGAAPDRSIFNALQSKISASPFEDRISLIGAVDAQTKWRLLDSAYALVFPSTYAYEAQPLTIVEAMSRGLPVIAFDTGGIRDLVVSGLTGFLVDSDDPRGLLDAMHVIAANKDLQRDLGRQAYAFYEEHLSRSAYERGWAQVLGVKT